MSNLQDAIKAIKAGDLIKGQQLLRQYVHTNPKDEVAWMWLAAAIEHPSKKKKCLQRVLEINPNNLTAKRGVAELKTVEEKKVAMPTLDDIVPKVHTKEMDAPKLRALSSKKVVPSPESRSTKDADINPSPKFTILDPLSEKNQIEEIIFLFFKAFLFFGGLPVGVMLILGIIIFILPSLNDSLMLNLAIGYFQALMIPAILVCGAILGIVGLFAALYHTLTVRRNPSGKFKGALKVHQVRNIELMLPYDKVFDLCFQAAFVSGGKIYVNDQGRGKILARTGRSLYSWGETISFNLNRSDTEKTRVRVSSKPRLLANPVDYGSNLDNVEAIVNFLKLKVQENFTEKE